MHSRLRHAVLVLAFTILASGCSQGSTPKAESTSAMTTKTSESLLVGTWKRVNSCEAFVGALRKAGLFEPHWLADAGYFATTVQIDKAAPCKGAKEIEHSHFFTDSGGLGSHDETGAQVDDGDYKIIDSRTLTFPSHEQEFGYNITVHYRIEGDALSFDVVVPSPCVGKCREATQWAISAFYPGLFHRAR